MGNGAHYSEILKRKVAKSTTVIAVRPEISFKTLSSSLNNVINITKPANINFVLNYVHKSTVYIILHIIKMIGITNLNLLLNS